MMVKVSDLRSLSFSGGGDEDCVSLVRAIRGCEWKHLRLPGSERKRSPDISCLCLLSCNRFSDFNGPNAAY